MPDINQPKYNFYTLLLRGALLLGFFVLFGRLVELQVIKGNYYRSLADDNRVREIAIPAPRGRILARGGEELSLTEELPNFENKRVYPLASASAQITGYLAQTSDQTLGKIDPHCPEKGIHKTTQLEGRGGIEESYDCTLRGIDGAEINEVDINGNKLRTIGRKPALPGRDVQTTIDFGLQKKVGDEMNGKIGAVVATDSEGQVLSLFSSPSFDPNLFISPKENILPIQKLLNDKSLPLFNRAINGTYHPGSVFKLVVGAGALADAAISKDSKFVDNGVLSINGFDYSSWYFTQYGRVEGEQNFAQALSRSTDTFFYRVGEREGIDRLVYWANEFGVGSKTGIDIPGEVAGILPSPKWKQDVLGERWFLGNTFHFSIGQGDLLVTPLQVNLWTSAFFNGEKYCKPYLSLSEGRKNCRTINISHQVIDEVVKGMKMACETGGTAYPFFTFEPKVACKTGTAETGTQGKTHAWFTVAAPADKPEIVLTVLVENGGEGSQVAAPIAKNILDYWFKEHQQN